VWTILQIRYLSHIFPCAPDLSVIWDLQVIDRLAPEGIDMCS
jgi:hypothetical protein